MQLRHDSEAVGLPELLHTASWFLFVELSISWQPFPHCCCHCTTTDKAPNHDLFCYIITFSKPPLCCCCCFAKQWQAESLLMPLHCSTMNSLQYCAHWHMQAGNTHNNSQSDWICGTSKTVKSALLTCSSCCFHIFSKYNEKLWKAKLQLATFMQTCCWLSLLESSVSDVSLQTMSSHHHNRKSSVE